MYASGGRPSTSSSGGFLGGATPAYAPAPVATPPQNAPLENSIEAQASMGCLVDPNAIAAGSIAIVIPRERLGL